MLKGDNYLRLSVGGRDDDKTKIKKTKALAQIALERMW